MAGYTTIDVRRHVLSYKKKSGQPPAPQGFVAAAVAGMQLARMHITVDKYSEVLVSTQGRTQHTARLILQAIVDNSSKQDAGLPEIKVLNELEAVSAVAGMGPAVDTANGYYELCCNHGEVITWDQAFLSCPNTQRAFGDYGKKAMDALVARAVTGKRLLAVTHGPTIDFMARSLGIGHDVVFAPGEGFSATFDERGKFVRACLMRLPIAINALAGDLGLPPETAEE